MVVVTGGPFDAFKGVFERSIPGRQRCDVLLQILGGLVSVQLDEVAVKKNVKRSILSGVIASSAFCLLKIDEKV